MDALKVLGLKPGHYTAKQIKAAYRERAKECHPDAGGSTEAFVELGKAYRKLQGGTKPMQRIVVEWDYSVLKEEQLRKKENKFQREVINAVESVAGFVFNCHGSRMQKVGMPDLYIAHSWWSGWLELKCQNRKLEPLQRKRILELTARRVPAFVLRWRNGSVCAEWVDEESIAVWSWPLDPRDMFRELVDATDALSGMLGKGLGRTIVVPDAHG
jgi:hypothetical protein